MTEQKILIENEKQANQVAAEVMRITFLILTIIYILDIRDKVEVEHAKEK